MSAPQAELRVGVMGAGAIGCYVGGVLAATGVHVVLVGRARVKAEIEAHGLGLSDLEGRARMAPPGQLTVMTDPGALAACQVVLCCVKSAGTRDAGLDLAPVLAPGTLVVSLQNGVRNADVLREALPALPVLGGIVSFNVVAAGEEGQRSAAYRQTTTGPLLVEASSDPRARVLVDALTRAGLEAAFAKDIRASQWAKLVINLSNAVSALSDVPTSQLLLSPGYRRVMALLMREAIDVLQRAGIRPGKLGPLPTRFFPMILGLPTPILRAVARAQLKVDPNARSSMWEDLSRGRPTEVDDLNGEIVRQAARVGAKAPANQRVVLAVHRAEDEKQGSPRLSAERLWATIAGTPGTS